MSMQLSDLKLHSLRFIEICYILILPCAFGPYMHSFCWSSSSWLALLGFEYHCSPVSVTAEVSKHTNFMVSAV